MVRSMSGEVRDPEPKPAAAQLLAERCGQAMMAADVASRSLGMELVEVAPGRARVRMQVAAAMVNGHRICHGGYLFTLADSAFAFACNTYGEVVVAAGADITFLSSAAEGDALEAVALERTVRGRTGIYDVTIRRLSDGETLAEFRGRSRNLRRPLPLAATDVGSAGGAGGGDGRPLA